MSKTKVRIDAARQPVDLFDKTELEEQKLVLTLMGKAHIEARLIALNTLSLN